MPASTLSTQLPATRQTTPPQKHRRLIAAGEGKKKMEVAGVFALWFYIKHGNALRYICTNKNSDFGLDLTREN